MSKLTIAEVAEKLGVSKEAIHNRIRRGSLKSVMVKGVKMVVLDDNAPLKATPKRTTQRKVSAQPDDRYYKLLESQNTALQAKVDKLEGETRSLRDQKEQMLVDERKKIEQIYKDKDEQLKNILNAISSKFMLNAPQDVVEQTEDLVEAEIDESKAKDTRLISLKKYLKGKNFSKKKIVKTIERFKKHSKDDSRIVTIGKKLYIDLEKYDYSDYSL